VHRLIGEQRLDGVTRIDIALTHFHLDHVCGLAYRSALPVAPTVYAPGAWLYGRASADILAPLLESPISPFDARPEIRELRAEQRIGAFALTARAQPRHWDPTAGLRVDDALALITDTGYDPGSAELARGVGHLLHEAWTPGDEHDASQADAERVAREAGAGRLTPVHLHPSDPRNHDGLELVP
jgi:ribonuclease BN (tRNA processing enzyme)